MLTGEESSVAGTSMFVRRLLAGAVVLGMVLAGSTFAEGSG
jgi:hypothetical protein